MPMEYYEPDMDVSSFLMPHHNRLDCEQTNENKDTMTRVLGGTWYYVGGFFQFVADSVLSCGNTCLGLISMAPKNAPSMPY